MHLYIIQKTLKMKIIEVVFIMLILLTLNEYRLIKKHIKNMENLDPTRVEVFLLKLNKQIKRPINWFNYKFLNNDLKY
jgi:hypothetical protein